jgi:hypothetical protein
VSFKTAAVWGLALAALLLFRTALGAEQGRDLVMMVSALIVIGIVAWGIWKGEP